MTMRQIDRLKVVQALADGYLKTGIAASQAGTDLSPDPAPAAALPAARRGRLAESPPGAAGQQPDPTGLGGAGARADPRQLCRTSANP